MFERLAQLCRSQRPTQHTTSDRDKKRENLQLFQRTIYSAENEILNKARFKPIRPIDFFD